MSTHSQNPRTPSKTQARRCGGCASLAPLVCCDKLSVHLQSFVARLETTNTHSITLFANLDFGIVCTISILDQIEM
jgi:hypothetical protein